MAGLFLMLDGSDVQTLSEVVVVGYGEQKKATLSGAVAVVSGAEVMTSPATNLSNILAGRMPGLFVITRSANLERMMQSYVYEGFLPLGIITRLL